MEPSDSNQNIVLPGEIVRNTTGDLMPGNNVMVRDGKIIACVRGVVEPMNKYIMVRPITSIYRPYQGDIVVGRIAQVLKQRWKVQIGCSVMADLRLSAIYLPDDQFRRRTTADERNMRQYFDVGDILCAEIQQTSSDGMISLHTRQNHPRKLENGIVVEIPSRVIKRVPKHIDEVEFDGFKFSMIFGLNGSIWVAPTDEASISLLPRIRNTIILLATYDKPVCVETVQKAYNKLSNIPVTSITDPESIKLLKD